MNTNSEFTQWLHDRIRESGKSQSELAYAGGISASQISRVLSGTREPGSDFCRAIARALDVPPEIVFRRAGLLPDNPNDPPDVKEALHLFRRLPVEKRRDFLAQMRAIIELVETEDRIPAIAEGPGRRWESE